GGRGAPPGPAPARAALPAGPARELHSLRDRRPRGPRHGGVHRAAPSSRRMSLPPAVYELLAAPGAFALAALHARRALGSGRAAVELLALVAYGRSEEHTSELQSRVELVCRLLLEKKQKRIGNQRTGGQRTHDRRKAIT